MAKKRHTLLKLTKKISSNKKWLLVIFLFLFLSRLYFFDFKAGTFHIDEHEFIRKSYYFDLFFSKRNLDDPRWYTEDSPLQPKLGPYIYGLSLHLNGIQNIEKNLEKIEFHNINQGDTSWWWEWWAKPLQDPPDSLLPSFNLVWQSRKVSILFSLSAFFLLFLLCTKSKNISFALLTTFLLGINPLMYAFGRKAMTDSMQLFAFILNLLLFTFLVKALEKKASKKAILLSLAMGVNLAFGVGVKVSGMLTLVFLIIMFSVLFALKAGSKPYLRLLTKSFSIITISFLVIFIFFHPYLYQDTFRRFYSMFADRLAEDVENRVLLPLHAVHSRQSAIKLVITRTLISPEITNLNFYNLPLDAFLFVVGFLVMGSKALKTLLNKKTISGELIFVIWSLVAFIGLILYLRIDMPRYYLPTIASFTIIQSYAIIYLLHDLWFVSQKKPKPKKRKARSSKATRKRRS